MKRTTEFRPQMQRSSRLPRRAGGAVTAPLAAVGAAVLCLSCLPHAGMAQQSEIESGWRASVGLNWRQLGDVELRGMAMGPANDGFVNGSVRDVGAGLFEYNVEDSVRQVNNVTLDKVEYQKVGFAGDSHEGLEDGVGLALSMAKPLGGRGDIEFEVELSLLTLWAEDSVHSLGQSESYQFDLAPNTWTNANAPAPGGGPDPDVTTETFAVYNRSQMLSPVSNVDALITHRFDVDMVTLGLGLNAAVTPGGRARLSIGAGPALTLLHHDVTRRTSVQWEGTADPIYRTREHDGSTALRCGLYAAAGVACQLRDDLHVQLSGRYDYIPVSVRSDFASIDLSGASMQLSLVWRF